MATDADGPSYRLKKSKLPSLEAAAEDQGLLPEAREDAGGPGDRISKLPDGVLGDIVSLLPTKEGARTQILASRWRHLWRSAPLNLDCGGLDCNRRIDRVVPRILAAHTGPGRHLILPWRHAAEALLYGCPAATMEAWLRSPALDNLQEIEFCFYVEKYKSMGIPLCLPASTFGFAATLRLASIESCHFPEDAVQLLNFPQLKHLALTHVFISEGTLHRLIAGCPALECLLLWNISGSRCARINALKIRSIGVFAPSDSMGMPFLEELVIENAPCLERLLHAKLLDGLRVSVINAPKLETFFSLDMVVDLMRFFPCLEKLYLQYKLYRLKGPKNGRRRKHRNHSKRTCFP